MTFDAFFGIGIPHAQPGDYGEASVWPGVVFFAGIPLLIFVYGFMKWKIRKKGGVKPEIHSIEPTATSMPCGYCGRENDLEAAHCKECGTPFPNSAMRP